jgi:hypothetical protein
MRLAEDGVPFVEREDAWEGSRPRDPFFAKPGRFRNPGSSNA